MKRSLALASVASILGIAVAGAQLAACSSSTTNNAADGGDGGDDVTGEFDSPSMDSTQGTDSGNDVTTTVDAADGAAADSGDGATPDGGDAATDGGADGASDDGGDAAADGGHDGAVGDGGDAAADAAQDSAADSSAEAAADSGCTGTTSVPLTVYNFKAWCSLTVGGTAIDAGTLGTTTETMQVCVAPGATLSAVPNGGFFEIGTPPLPFISGTSTTVTDTTGTASTTLATGATCVFACCPFSGDGGAHTAGSGCTGITNPCTDAGVP
jgi:hypothetical protein